MFTLKWKTPNSNEYKYVTGDPIATFDLYLSLEMLPNKFKPVEITVISPEGTEIDIERIKSILYGK